MIRENYAKLKEWWGNLASREKQIIVIGSCCAALCFVYFCLFSPLIGRVTTLRQQIRSQQKTLVWMQTADKEIQKLEKETQHKTQQNSSVLLLGEIQKRIKQADLSQSLSQLKQNSNRSIEIHFKKVKFDSLMQFLISLLKEQNTTISQMSVTAENTSGMVNADLIISNG